MNNFNQIQSNLFCINFAITSAYSSVKIKCPFGRYLLIGWFQPKLRLLYIWLIVFHFANIQILNSFLGTTWTLRGVLAL